MTGHRERTYPPGSPQWVKAWEANPKAIADELTPEERHDPDLNPLHPCASASARWVPGKTAQERTIHRAPGSPWN